MLSMKHQKRLSASTLLRSCSILVSLSLCGGHFLEPLQPTPIVSTAATIQNVHWSADSQHLFFEAETWYDVTFKVTNVQLSETSFSKIQVSQVSAQTLAQLSLATDTNTNTSLIFLSPNSHYAVYAAPKTADTVGYPLALTDMRLNKTTLIPQIEIQNLEDVDFGYRIDWSSAGTAFTVRRHSEFGADSLYYVSGFSNNLNAATVTEFSQVNTDGENIGIDPSVSAISADGDSLLLSGYFYAPHRLEARLLLWQVDAPEKTTRLPAQKEGLITAAFSADGSSVLFIDPNGLQRIELSTRQITMIDPTINAVRFERGWFSPDASKLALLERKTPQQINNALYIVRVESL
jgi:hypothetical protein